MEKTMQMLAKDAIGVQDACNLSGVVHGFSGAISRLRELNPGKGTDWINHHPICLLWADKIAHLTGTQHIGDDATTNAYTLVYKLVAGEDIEY